MKLDKHGSKIMHWVSRVYVVLLLTILGGIVIHAPVSVFFGGVVWPEYDLIVKSWKEVLLLVAGGLAVIMVTYARRWQELWGDWLIRLATAYALLHVLFLFIFDTGALSAVAGLMIDLRYVLYFVLVYVAVRLNPDLRRPFLWVYGIGAGLVVGFAMLQVFVLPVDALRHIGYSEDTILPYMTIDQNPDYVRINSTLRGPNPLGAYSVIVLVAVGVLVAYRRIAGWRLWTYVSFLFAGGLVTLWASYSRSALVATTTALLFILITTVGKRVGWRKLALGFAALGLIGLTTLFVMRDSDFVANVIMHENPESSSATKSNDEHLNSLIEGTELMVSQPLGAGVGSTGSASLYGDNPLIIENQYLFVAHEVGWLGLILFMALFVLIMWRLWLQRSDWLAMSLLASGIGLSLIGLLLPVWVDDTVSIVWWGLAGLAMGLYNNKNEKSQKGERA